MDIISFILSAAGFLSTVNIIITFIEKIKGPVNKAVKKEIENILQPVNDKLNIIQEDIIRLDKNECKNYLTEFLEDLKKGIEKTDIEKQRATEVYDHYTKDLNLNSYIHSEWEKLMK